MTNDVLDFVRVTRLPAPMLLRVARLFAYGLHALYKLGRKLPPFRPHNRSARRTQRTRTVHELSLTWFDALSSQYDSRHTEAEVVRAPGLHADRRNRGAEGRRPRYRSGGLTATPNS